MRKLINNSIVMFPPFTAILIPSPDALNFSAIMFYIIGIAVVSSDHEVLDHTNIHTGIFRVDHDQSRFDRFIIRSCDFYLTYLLNPICGRIPYYYKIQHVYIHHVENNGLEDTQSTLPYDKTSYFDFCRVALKFGIDQVFSPNVIAYLLRRRRIKPLRKLLGGLAIWYLALAALCTVNWPAALLLFLTRFLAAVGQTKTFYAWHGLADPDDPDNVFRNSTNFELGDDHGGIGAAIHIEHHIHPGRHWSVYATDAAVNGPTYKKEGAIVLKWVGSRFEALFLKALWSRRFDQIAGVCEALDDTGRDTDQLARIIETRARPVAGKQRHPVYRKLDRAFGRMVGSLLIFGSLRTAGPSAA